MSAKSVELLSRHKGNVGLTIGEKKLVVFFEDKGDVGRAMVEVEVAEALVGLVGGKDFWLSGRASPATAPTISPAADSAIGDQQRSQDTTQTGGQEVALAPSLKAVEDYSALRAINPPAKGLSALKAALQDCFDQPLLMTCIAQEAQANPTRQTWMAALNERLDAIQKPAQP